MDGSYRPLVGEVINIITFSNVNNPSKTKQVAILKTDSDINIKNKITSAINSIIDRDRTYSEMMKAREEFFRDM